jgi:hypothetical protein
MCGMGARLERPVVYNDHASNEELPTVTSIDSSHLLWHRWHHSETTRIWWWLSSTGARQTLEIDQYTDVHVNTCSDTFLPSTRLFSYMYLDMHRRLTMRVTSG